MCQRLCIATLLFLYTTMVIAVDFDGTIVEHKYPRIGDEIPFAIDTLKELIKDGHQLILWSVREGELLQEAVDWCHKRGVDFWAVNKDYPEEERSKNNHFSRKLKVDMFIDDRNVGGLPDWGLIYQMIKERKTFRDIYTQGNIPAEQNKKKKWWF